MGRGLNVRARMMPGQTSFSFGGDYWIVRETWWLTFVRLDHHSRASGLANGLRSELIRD